MVWLTHTIDNYHLPTCLWGSADHVCLQIVYVLSAGIAIHIPYVPFFAHPATHYHKNWQVWTLCNLVSHLSTQVDLCLQSAPRCAPNSNLVQYYAYTQSLSPVFSFIVSPGCLLFGSNSVALIQNQNYIHTQMQIHNKAGRREKDPIWFINQKV